MSDNNIPSPQLPHVDLIVPGEAEGEAFEQQPEVIEQGVPYMTRAEFEEAKALILAQVERTAQSYADKTASRLDKRVAEETAKLNSSIETLRAGGIEVPDEQVRAARRAILDRALLQNDDITPPSPSPASPPESGKGEGPAPTQLTPEAAYVKLTMSELNSQFGTTLEPDDPEAEGMQEVTDPFAFIRMYRENIQKKAQRVAVPPQARVASVVNGSNVAPTTLQAVTDELAQELASPKKDLGKIQKLSAQLSKLRGEPAR